MLTIDLPKLIALIILGVCAYHGMLSWWIVLAIFLYGCELKLRVK